MATALVSQGQVLQAQYRLGHRDASTTLRTYSHPLPAADAQAAATIENMLAGGRWGLAVGGDPQTSSTIPAPSSAVMRRWPGSPPRRAG